MLEENEFESNSKHFFILLWKEDSWEKQRVKPELDHLAEAESMAVMGLPDRYGEGRIWEECSIKSSLSCFERRK